MPSGRECSKKPQSSALHAQRVKKIVLMFFERLFAWDYDVAQNVSQEPNFYYYGQVYIGGLFKAFRTKGESLGFSTFIRKSPRDDKYLWHALETINIFLERPAKAYKIYFFFCQFCL